MFQHRWFINDVIFKTKTIFKTSTTNKTYQRMTFANWNQTKIIAKLFAKAVCSFICAHSFYVHSRHGAWCLESYRWMANHTFILCCKVLIKTLSHLLKIIQNSQAGVWTLVNTLRPRENGRHFADDIFKCIFLNENFWIPIKISLKLVPKGPINNIPVLVQIMAWPQPGDKPLSEPMMVSLLTHICVTRPQWVN